MPTPRDRLHRQVQDIVTRHLIRPTGHFRAHELVEDLVDELGPDPIDPGLTVEANSRRLAWFTDAELTAELTRRAQHGARRC